MLERDLATQVAQYIQYRYPHVIYRFDLAADMKLSVGQARRHKKMHPKRGYPDLLICEPRNERLTGVYTGHYCGLFIELKAKTIYKKDGSLLANDHVAEQKTMLEWLETRGYMARFAVGFDEAKKLIDDYLTE